MNTSDVVIIGAGIVGCSLAFELAREGVEVMVLERDHAGEATSGVNQGGIRQQFESPVKVRAARETVRILSGFAETFGVDPDYRQNGYLFLLSGADSEIHFGAMAERQRRGGLDIRMLTPRDAAALIPALDTHELRAAMFCPTDGYADPRAIVRGYKVGAQRLGAVFREEQQVIELCLSGCEITQVRTASGRYAAGIVVNAAGPWAPDIAKLYGHTLPIEARRSSIYLLGTRAGEFASIPLIIDVDRRVTICPRHDGVMVGSARKPVVENPPPVPQCDWSFAPEMIARAAARLPPLATMTPSTGWAGYWEVTPDDDPILGWTHADNLYSAAGFSGHGMSVIPGFMRSVAQAIRGVATDLPIESFGIERFSKPLSARGEIWGGTTIARAEAGRA